jgi:hypothetical protein
MPHKLFGQRFKASSVEEFEALQLAMFAEGIVWGNGSTSLHNEYFDLDVRSGGRGFTYLMVKGDNRMWRGDTGRDGAVEYTTSVKAKFVDNRLRIEIEGKTYLLADVQSAMSVFGVSEVPQ